MAVTITDNRITINEGDSTTGWTSTNALTANSTSPTPVESTARLDISVSNTIENSYYNLGSPVNMSSGSIIYAWMSHRAEFDLTSNVGVGIQIGDGTNRTAYAVMGSDNVAFSHFEGPVTWQCIAFDVGNKESYLYSASLAGTPSSLNTSSIQDIGFYFKTVVKAVGGAVNCFIDIMRYLDPNISGGCALDVTGGTTSDPGTFLDIATEDRQIGNLQARGVVRRLGAGLFGVQGPLRFGNWTGTNTSSFYDKNVTVAFEDRKFKKNKYKILIVDNGVGETKFQLGTKVGTGTTATGTDGCSIISPTGVGATFISSGSNTTISSSVLIYGSTFSGFSEDLFFMQNQEFIGGSILNSGTINVGTGSAMYFLNNNVSNCIKSSSLYWNTNSDPSGRLDGCTFTMGTTSSHAIEFGPNTPTEITLAGIQFNNYYDAVVGTNLTASSGPTSASIYNNSGKSITINITSGGNTPSVRNGTSSTTTIVNAISISVTGLKDNTEIRVYETGTENEIAGIEQVEDGDPGGEVDNRTFTFSSESGNIVDIVIISLDYINIRIDEYTIPSQNSSIPVSQVFDRNYENP